MADLCLEIVVGRVIIWQLHELSIIIKYALSKFTRQIQVPQLLMSCCRNAQGWIGYKVQWVISKLVLTPTLKSPNVMNVWIVK
jgi:hypothetical protein